MKEESIWIGDHAAQLIREKVMMSEPNYYDYLDKVKYNAAVAEYNKHILSRRSFPYPVKEEQDGKEIPESEFRLQHQYEAFVFNSFKWVNCHADFYKATSSKHRIIAIPIEPDTHLKDEGSVKWAEDLRNKISLFIETGGYKLLPSASTEILAMIYESSPPDPSNKECEKLIWAMIEEWQDAREEENEEYLLQPRFSFVDIENDLYEWLKKFPDKEGLPDQELLNDPFIKKHLARIKELTLEYHIQDKLQHLQRPPFDASVKYFLETGTVNGNFLLAIKSLFDNLPKVISEPDTPLQPVKEEMLQDQKETNYAGQKYQRVFNWLRNINFKAFKSEMDDIIKIIQEDFPPEPSSKEQEGDQDELWKEVGKIVMDGFDYSNQESVTAKLKQKFQLYKSQP